MYFYHLFLCLSRVLIFVSSISIVSLIMEREDITTMIQPQTQWNIWDILTLESLSFALMLQLKLTIWDGTKPVCFEIATLYQFVHLKSAVCCT